MSAQRTSSSGNASGNNLARGQACLPCRRKKMRCDGQKPVCGQCIRGEREDDCEYTMDVQGLTRTQMLEEEIALLETKIRELENPGQSSSVRLRSVNELSAVGSGGSGGSSGSSTSNSSHRSLQEGQFGTLELINPFASIDLASTGQSLDFSPEPPRFTVSAPPNAEERSILVNTFIPHASRMSFFLHIPRFINTVAAEHYAIEGNGLLDVLVTSVCLWGCRLSNNPAFHAKEEEYFCEVIHKLSSSLFIEQRDRTHEVLYIIQAEVLLANYLFFNRRFLEGRYHCSAAISLALTCRLNFIRSGSTTPIRTGTSLTLTTVLGNIAGLPIPIDQIQEGERINAFWTVYILDKCWSVALGSPSSINEDGVYATQIDTPWPLSMEGYSSGHLAPGSRYTQTVTTFLGSAALGDDHGISDLAILAKASVLFSRAAWLASQYKAGISDKDQSYIDFHALELTTSNFISTIVFVQELDWETGSNSLVALILARVALIQLYSKFVPSTGTAEETRISTASAALSVMYNLDGSTVQFLNPIVAILLSTIGQVYVGEIVRVRTLGISPADPYLITLVSSVNRVVTIMRKFTTECPLMAHQCSQIEQAAKTFLA
ncbi:hypothetical protein C8Q75DRAFT_805167 [Abortiporus biennis]|nr:hypothetical protein C8Q75DRAFT_805167 [Abortiporus biennis]